MVMVRSVVVPRASSLGKDVDQGEKGKGTGALTRLEREARRLMAIDVEYSVILLDSERKRLQLPAEVCVINVDREVVLRTTCDARSDLLAPEVRDESMWHHRGGVPPEEWMGSPSLAEVRSDILRCIDGKPVVGHNLIKDLTSLGMEDAVPMALRRDTMRYSALQGARGFGRSLAELTKSKLGRSIQVDGRRHDPYEDAVAALDLYLKYVHFDEERMEYDDLVEHYTRQILNVDGEEPFSLDG